MTPEELRSALSAYIAPEELTDEVVRRLLIYVDLLMKWNARMNLTAVRHRDQIVRRHFGESLFAAAKLASLEDRFTYIDVGSGAGFPGLPLKILRPQLQATLIESQNKKVTFLREVIRSIALPGIDVHYGRAEQYPKQADLVTLRAVESFETVIATADRLVAPGGRLALMIGAGQFDTATKLLPGGWDTPIEIPGSEHRIIAIRHKD